MKHRAILISGAGVAGLALAHWLARDGHSVTAVDRARAFDARGHLIALKGTAIKILQTMGMYEALESYRLPAAGIRYCTSTGRILRERALSEQKRGLGGYLMVRRAHLIQVLHDRRPSALDLRYGREIRAVNQTDRRVSVTFSDGTNGEYDVVLAADGVHSNTRRLLRLDLSERYMRGTYVVFLVRTDQTLGKTGYMYFGPGRNLNVLPVTDAQAAVIIYQDDACAPVPESTDPRAWREYLLRTYADFPERVQRLLAVIGDDDEIYADDIVMVPPTQLAASRVALVGDAGYCPTFFSGMGAAAALQGSYCLAQQLSSHDDDVAALRSYQSRMTTVAVNYQKSAERMRNLILARSWSKRTTRNLWLRMVPQRLWRAQARRFYRTEVTMEALAQEGNAL